jgi:hypothetical protein
MSLKTTYKDDIIASGSSRRYSQTSNSDGTISLVDKTSYQQKGDDFGAKDINEITTAINRVNHITEVTLPKDDWSGSSAPYTQTVAVSGILAEDNPWLVSVLSSSASLATQQAYRRAFAIISAGSATTSDGSVTFKVYKKPETSITVGLKGV